MKKFIKKILLIILFLAGISIVMVSAAYLLRDNILNFKIPADCHVVFVGNSQFEMAINDSTLIGCKNVSKSAKQYLFMRVDIEQLITKNPQIDTIFLVVSPFSIRESDADRSYEDKAYIESITYYAPYLSISDLQMIPISLPFIKDMLFGGCLKYLATPQQVGGYIWNMRDDMNADKKKHEREEKAEKTGTPTTVQNGDEITRAELKKIADVCNENHIKLIYLSTPNWKAKETYDIPAFRKQVTQLLEQSGADYWDYVDYPLPDSCYSDMTHLNWKGAILYTKLIKERLGR